MKISVLTPSYNSVKYIEKAIQSVLSQDYQNVEHIVADGGSTDGTVEVLKKYSSVKWVSEKDNGQSDAMNKAFAMSKGDIIVYLNADDYFEPDVFGTIIKTFQNNETDIVVGNLYNRYFDNDKVELVKQSSAFKKILFPIRYNFPLNPVSYFYKRQVQETLGNFPENEYYAMDYWFLLRAFHHFKTIKIELPLGTFYRTGLNKTSLNKDAGHNVEQMAKKYVSTLGTNWAIWYKLNFIRFSIWHAFKFSYWKIPLKYFYYLMFARKKFKNFDEFQSVGYNKFRSN